MLPSPKGTELYDIKAVWRALFGEDLDLARRVTANQVAVLCPWHAERHPSCHISLDKNAFFCRSCSSSGGALDAVILEGHASNRREAANWVRAHS